MSTQFSSRHPRHAVRSAIRRVVLAGFALSAAVSAGAATPSTLRIRPEVRIDQPTLRLADVLSFAGADTSLADALAEKPAAAELRGATALTLTHEQIETRLSELGVNLGQVLLTGAPQCRVTYAPAAVAPAAPALPPAPADAADSTLAQRLREFIAQDVADLGGTPEVDFERAGQPYLELSGPQWEFIIRPLGHEKLGLREFRVALRQDGKVQRSATLSARVRLAREVVVARQPLNVGTVVEREALVLESRLFEQEADIGLLRTEQAIGQRVARFVPAGQMLTSADLKNVDLVQRGRPVALLGNRAHVQMRLTGVALDGGCYGETVRVRLGEARNNKNVLRGVVTGLGTVRIEEETP